MSNRIKPLNDQERKTAVRKFLAIGIITMVAIAAVIRLYQQLPDALTLAREPVAAPVVDEQGGSTSVQEKLKTAAQYQSNINLMLLVDATPGMEVYIPAVASAVETISQSYRVDIVAACYRDAAEGPWLYLNSAMTGQTPAQWLRDLSTTVQYDQDEPEAVYYALETSLQSEHLKKGESNILILVGDAGNHAQEATTQVSPSSIVQLLIEKHCHFAAFQTRFPVSHPAFGQFSRQLMDEIMTPALQTYTPEGDVFTRQQEAEGTSFSAHKASYYQLYTPQQNQSLSPEQLRNKIISFTDSTIRIVYQRIHMIEDLQQGKVPAENQYQTILPVLEYHGISSQDLQQLQKNNP